ncbi:MAG: phosphatidylinositol mannoside acyltransferase [Acidimicrobiia bacterium]
MKQTAAYLALRLAVGVTGLLPEPVMRRLGQLGGLIWHSLDPGRRQMARRHMTRVGASDPRRASRGVFVSYGRYWAEAFWVRPRRFSRLRATMEVEGIEHLRQARDAGRGAVLALPHLGNWEVSALIAVDLPIPLLAVAERLANRRITEWFTRQRSMFDIEVVLTGRGSTRRLADALLDGKAVALLCDRDLSGRGIEVEFFGERTTLPAGPAALAIKAGAPLIPIGVYFGPGPVHRAVIHPPLTFDEETINVAQLTQQLATEFEAIIGAAPSQWHLVQPNWPSDRS